MPLRWTTCAALWLGLAIPTSAQDRPQANVPMVVTSGEATIRRAPDQAFVTAVVETRGRVPRDVQQQNAQAMTGLMQRLTATGIPRDAIRTLGYSVQPDAEVVNGRRVPKGFVAINAVEVRIDAVERTGEVVDAAAQGGATSVGGVRFDLKDRRSVERDALRQAVADARARADAAAAGAGQTVVGVLRIDDGRSSSPPMAMALRMQAESVAATPIEPSVIEITATVTLTAAVK